MRFLLETYELFNVEKRWDQYESAGMQKYMKELSQRFSRFNCHECVIPPGPIAYIPSFVRKNGEEEIIYDLEACEELLKDTYGITVYQEQVMLLSQN
jgi:DNA polymerase-3 subunit alpha